MADIHDDETAARIAAEREAYRRAVSACHDGEAEWHEREVDRLLHKSGHYAADVQHVLDDLGRMQP